MSMLDSDTAKMTNGYSSKFTTYPAYKAAILKFLAETRVQKTKSALKAVGFSDDRKDEGGDKSEEGEGGGSTDSQEDEGYWEYDALGALGKCGWTWRSKGKGKGKGGKNGGGKDGGGKGFQGVGYNCNQKGHSARNCPSPIKCHKCGQNGHISPNCPHGALHQREAEERQAAEKEASKEKEDTAHGKEKACTRLIRRRAGGN